MQPFLAYIVPVNQDTTPPSGNVPMPPIYYPPINVMPPIYYPPVYPAHPIAPGGQPPVDPGFGAGWQPPVWGGAPPPGYPAHPIAPGGPPPQVTHPIAPGGPPPQVTHPIPPSIWPNPPEMGVIQPPPVHVEHPIPPEVWPTPPGAPPGGETGSISNPINLPPSEAGGDSAGFWAMAYFNQLDGWVWVWVPIPTPDKGREGGRR